MEGQTVEPDVPRPSALNRFRRHLGLVYDLSVQGVRLCTQAAIKPGEEVALSLRLPKQIASAEIAVATVQWSKDSFYGLAFRKLSHGSQSRLRKYLASASRMPYSPGSRRH